MYLWIWFRLNEWPPTLCLFLLYHCDWHCDGSHQVAVTPASITSSQMVQRRYVYLVSKNIRIQTVKIIHVHSAYWIFILKLDDGVSGCSYYGTLFGLHAVSGLKFRILKLKHVLKTLKYRAVSWRLTLSPSSGKTKRKRSLYCKAHYA
jgi:uncharacterized membrane protein YGL010W